MTFVVVRELDTTKLGRVPGMDDDTFDKNPPSPLKNVENTVFDTSTSVKTPVPTGYENGGAGVPDLEKLICYLETFVLRFFLIPATGNLPGIKLGHDGGTPFLGGIPYMLGHLRNPYIYNLTTFLAN